MSNQGFTMWLDGYSLLNEFSKLYHHLAISGSVLILVPSQLLPNASAIYLHASTFSQLGKLEMSSLYDVGKFSLYLFFNPFIIEYQEFQGTFLAGMWRRNGI